MRNNFRNYRERIEKSFEMIVLISCSVNCFTQRIVRIANSTAYQSTCFQRSLGVRSSNLLLSALRPYCREGQVVSPRSPYNRQAS